MNYSKLPEEIVEKIVGEHLETYSQLTVFSRVSKHWRSVAIRSQNPLAAGQQRRLCLPGLLVTNKSWPFHLNPTRYRCIPPCQFLPLPTMFKHDHSASDDPPSTVVSDDSAFDVATITDPPPPPTTIVNDDDSNITDPPPLLLPSSKSNDDDDDSSASGDDTTSKRPPPPSPPWWSPPGLRETRRARRSMYIRVREGEDEFVELDKFHCISAKDGWLVLIQPPNSKWRSQDFNRTVKDGRILRRRLNFYLYNPITGDSIPLPPLIRPRQCYWQGIKRVILTSSPDFDQQCHVIVLFHSTPQLAWCKVTRRRANEEEEEEGNCWVFTGEKDRLFDYPEDAAYFGGKLYVVDRRNSCLHVLDDPITSSNLPAATTPRLLSFSTAMLSPSSYRKYLRSFCYLTELNGQLLLVLRHCYKSSVTFNVYRPDDDWEWEQVTSLEGHAMFLGYSQSFCIPSYNNGDGIRDSCIYFAFNFSGYYTDEDSWQRYLNCICGVFSLGDQTLQKFEPLDDPVCFYSEHGNYHYVWFLLMPSWNIAKDNEEEEGSNSDVMCELDEKSEVIDQEEEEEHMHYRI
ncbi:hypothetical protein LINPERHAP1_LOCUS11831, partial [Linum perenne]